MLMVLMLCCVWCLCWYVLRDGGSAGADVCDGGDLIVVDAGIVVVRVCVCVDVVVV